MEVRYRRLISFYMCVAISKQVRSWRWEGAQHHKSPEHLQACTPDVLTHANKAGLEGSSMHRHASLCEQPASVEHNKR